MSTFGRASGCGNQQQPPFDIVAWVLEVAGVVTTSNAQVLDVGCGNGMYLRELRRRGIHAVGCDLSRGMLAASAPHPRLLNADVTALPLPTAAFDVVCVRPVDVAPVTITDASIAADYVASVAEHYQDETVRPWQEVTREVRLEVQRQIDDRGAFVVAGEIGAFVCC